LKLFEEGYLLLAKPRIVHSIPGRLRLKVPLLRKIDKKHHGYTDLVCRLLSVPDGIDSVSASPISGTVLLHYDTESVSEQEVLLFISSLTRVIVAQKEELARLVKSDPARAFACISRWLQRAITRRLHIDQNQRIVVDDIQ
jgi:hypothetical protein